MALRARLTSNRIGAVSALVHKRVHDVTFAAATNIVERAAVSMEGQESPSKPGHPPAIDTGLLHDSLFVQELAPTLMLAGTNVEYAPHLEFGTVNMDARPFLLPAVEEERGDFERAMAAAVDVG